MLKFTLQSIHGMADLDKIEYSDLLVQINALYINIFKFREEMYADLIMLLNYNNSVHKRTDWYTEKDLLLDINVRSVFNEVIQIVKNKDFPDVKYLFVGCIHGTGNLRDYWIIDLTDDNVQEHLTELFLVLHS